MKPIASRVRIVLVRPSHPGNIGAAARAMKTMGVGVFSLVAPRHFPDADARALAAGAVDVLERASVHPTLEAALAGCVLAVGLSARTRDLSLPSFELRDAAPRIVDAAETGDVALVFGNETSGLSNEELGRCQWIVTIPATAEYSSLNLAAAVQVACYEVAMAAGARSTKQPRTRRPATLEDVEGLFGQLEAGAVESGYLDPARPGRLMQRLRRLFARTRLEREEVKFFRGLIAAFRRKMRR